MTTAKPQTLRELREARKLTIHDVSRLAGVDSRQLERWEAGKAEIDLGRVDLLAKVLDIPVTQIPLEPNRRHYSTRGVDFILRAHGHPRSGYTAQVEALTYRQSATARYIIDSHEETATARADAFERLETYLDDVLSRTPKE